MTMEDDRWKAMRFQGPEFIPVSVGVLPRAWKKHREKLEAIAARHPLLFGHLEPGQRDYDQMGENYREGQHVDPWGYVWANVAEGMNGYVKHHNVPTRQAVHRLRPPQGHHGLPHGFMFMRLYYLRGFEELMVDFAEEPPELQKLIDIVLDYNLGELEHLIAQLGPGPRIQAFGDDLGMQSRLPISPATWRKYLKPCYAALYGRCHEAGWAVYMHSDGHIAEIIPDLKDCGVDVINPQVRANGLDTLVEVCKGKICVDLDLDRQLFPFATPARLDAHVRQAVEALGSPRGGLWLKAEIGPDVPLANVEAICTALETYRAYFR
ncbi:MAG: uroporphyrinogen decarboxylase family protein [Candidatus Brocadiia bacterium]